MTVRASAEEKCQPLVSIATASSKLVPGLCEIPFASMLDACRSRTVPRHCYSRCGVTFGNGGLFRTADVVSSSKSFLPVSRVGAIVAAALLATETFVSASDACRHCLYCTVSSCERACVQNCVPA